ncbi:F-box domain-containing protein [Favolaschia claudopus]|uniref:F-box domain-containing protein n=1 Tax=Favolaschia claudopus TaxID=2862362 RepID=A0AAW0DFL4_9AGAR
MYPPGSINTLMAFSFYQIGPHPSRIPLESQTEAVASFYETSGMAYPWTYPIFDLPPEILSEIFVHVFPEYPQALPLNGPFSPLVLCQICRSWRAVALSTPPLWRAMKADLWSGDSDSKISKQLELFKLYLKRSGSCPLSVNLSHARKVTHRLVPQFLRALAAHTTRWEHIDLLMPFEYMYLFLGRDMPLLRSLTFGPSNYPHGRGLPRLSTLFDSAPQLTHLILTHNFFKRVFGMPFAQLTHIEADCLYVGECVEILREAPLLEVATFRMCQDIDQFAVLDPLRPASLIQHHCLHHLAVGSYHDAIEPPNLRGFLECFALPALRYLHIHERCISLPSLSDFIARSKCDLGRLHIAGATLTETVVREQLPPLGVITLE